MRNIILFLTYIYIETRNHMSSQIISLKMHKLLITQAII